MKYVFFDIDGTIRGKSREITKRNKENYNIMGYMVK